MNAYVDSSVILRRLFNQPDSMSAPKDVTRYVSSRLLLVECFRSCDRLKSMGQLDEDQLTEVLERFSVSIKYIDFIRVTDYVLDRASHVLGLRLGTLDAIHLFSALIWRESKKESLLFLTHDQLLAEAATRMGFEVSGV